MCKVVALVGVQGEAQAALILAQVVAEKVGIFRQVDSFQCKATQALTAGNCLVMDGEVHKVIVEVQYEAVKGAGCMERRHTGWCALPLARQTQHHQSLAWSHALVHP